jgi:hypothetical protein
LVGLCSHADKREGKFQKGIEEIVDAAGLEIVKI